MKEQEDALTETVCRYHVEWRYRYSTGWESNWRGLNGSGGPTAIFVTYEDAQKAAQQMLTGESVIVSRTSADGGPQLVRLVQVRIVKVETKRTLLEQMTNFKEETTDASN